MWSDVSAKPKILFVHDRFGAFAGAESNILCTAVELKARGFATAILHGPATGRGEEAWREAFENLFPLPSVESAGATTKAIEQFQPDAVYVHNIADLDVIEALLESDVPLVRMVHDHGLYCMRSYKYNFITRQTCKRALSPFCIFPCGAFVVRDHSRQPPIKWVSYTAKRRELDLNRQFDRMLVATEFMKNELLRNGFADNKIEIHAPVPPSAGAVEQSSFSERNLIVYAGQITRGKGVDVLLESLARVRAPFECVICGNGQHRAHCEKLSRELGLGNRVQFQGYLPPDQINGFHREASVVVMSSVWPEPFGAAGLEGMRFGVPVVAFDAGGIREWLADGQNGFLVPWMDRAEFAARIEQLLRDKALARRMGDAGRRLIATEFQFSKYVDRLEEMFARVTRSKEQPAFA